MGREVDGDRGGWGQRWMGGEEDGGRGWRDGEIGGEGEEENEKPVSWGEHGVPSAIGGCSGHKG